MQSTTFTFEAFEELEPGPRWQRRFDRCWPRYREWFLHEGEAARASYAESRRMLALHMPELVPTYERLCELAGGSDLAARMLALWRPPSFLSGCSQGVFPRGGPVLVRNYDYAPSRLEGAIVSTGWTGRRVIGMSDCLWGLLDGMNDAGLAVSLAFGGRPVLGEGFGVPLVVRYVLETCPTVAEAGEVLARVPHHHAHTLTLVDRAGEPLTVYLSPDREPVFRPVGVATNHQWRVEWAEHAERTRSLERERRLVALLEDPTVTAEEFAAAFLAPPLYSTGYSRGFGTLYTAAYRPLEGGADYLWPGTTWRQSFASFVEGTHVETLVEASVA